jgi:hypothetical protein
MSRHLHAESTFGRVLSQGLSLYIGVLVSAALLLSWYVILRESDAIRQNNMGPFIVVAAPFLSVPLVLLAATLDRLLFFWAPSLASRWSWYLLGVAMAVSGRSIRRSSSSLSHATRLFLRQCLP